MKVKHGQTINDVCLELFGTLENLFDMLEANGLTLNSKLVAGQQITVTTANLGDEDIKNFVILGNNSFNNLQITGLPPVAGAADYNVDYNNDFL